VKTINKYEVAGKLFTSKEEAINFENNLRNNLLLRARNLKVFYWKLRGYPGEYKATRLINNFCHNNKFTFGKWKGRCVGEIMMKHYSYVKWCIENIPFFKLNKEEQALYDSKWSYSVGGYSWNITTGDSYTLEGDSYNLELINWEEQQCL
jgi:hypothetical protein